ncbi:MAG: hypothetical protein NUV53_04380 [Patescibacteria group bacterium]|nr:hypothetical protein [Patescibacteria group bacterium]
MIHYTIRRSSNGVVNSKNFNPIQPNPIRTTSPRVVLWKQLFVNLNPSLIMMRNEQDEAQILEAIAGLGNPELHQIAKKIAALIPEGPLRSQTAVRLLGAIAAFAKIRNPKGPVITALAAKLNDLVQLFGGELFDSSGNVRKKNISSWREPFIASVPERLAEAGRTSEADIADKLKAEAGEMLALEEMLYPPGEKPTPFDWDVCFKNTWGEMENVFAAATPTVGRFANWAETLPGARRRDTR